MTYWQMLAQQPGKAQIGSSIASALASARSAKMQKNQLAAEMQARRDAIESEKMAAQKKELERARVIDMRRRAMSGDTAARDELVSVYPGDEYLDRTSKEAAERTAAGRYAVEQKMKADQMEAERNKPSDEVARSVVYKTGIQPSDPAFRSEYAKEQARMEAEARRKAVAMGGKMLPPSSVSEIADARSALESADRLLDNFVSSVPTEGAGVLGARIAQHIPNTETKTYSNNANIAAQVIGSYLEGGKLAESDFNRYKDMLPVPGDSKETAQKKVENLKAQIVTRTEGRASQLRGAGYNVPSVLPQPDMVSSQAQQQAAPAQQQMPQAQPQAQEPQQRDPALGRRGDTGPQSAPSPDITTKAFSPEQVIDTLRNHKKPYRAAQALVRAGVITEAQAAEYIRSARSGK